MLSFSRFVVPWKGCALELWLLSKPVTIENLSKNLENSGKTWRITNNQARKVWLKTASQALFMSLSSPVRPQFAAFTVLNASQLLKGARKSETSMSSGLPLTSKIVRFGKAELFFSEAADMLKVTAVPLIFASMSSVPSWSFCTSPILPSTLLFTRFRYCRCFVLLQGHTGSWFCRMLSSTSIRQVFAKSSPNHWFAVCVYNSDDGGGIVYSDRESKDVDFKWRQCCVTLHWGLVAWWNGLKHP